jgi:hypothetical protein
MTIGIRAFAIDTFNANLASREKTGNVEFRRTVMAMTCAAFDISIASAATHYNHALKLAKESNAAAVEGLGRSEDKKGGRKPIHTVDVIKVKTGELVVAGVSKAKADALVLAASAKGKVKLMIKLDEVVETATAEVTTEVATA